MTGTPNNHEPVVVFRTSRDDEMALAKSLLQSTGIPFFTRNEMTADLFGIGRIGGGSQVIGPMEILVAPKDADDTLAALSLSWPQPPDPADQWLPPDPPTLARRVLTATLFTLVVFLVIVACVFLLSRLSRPMEPPNSDQLFYASFPGLRFSYIA
ncbi:MAG: DUF2007 domain-containing protein [Coriobacteriia bacterium]|nr:DUF2007 domain-containing protein [Coriobacteriia bacterium]